MRESLVSEIILVPEPSDGRAVVTLAASEKIGHRFATASSYAKGAVNYFSYETPRRRPRSIKRRAVR
jgi:hypothetical protein